MGSTLHFLLFRSMDSVAWGGGGGVAQFTGCGTQDLVALAMRNLPGPGMEPMSPANAVHCTAREALSMSF